MALESVCRTSKHTLWWLKWLSVHNYSSKLWSVCSVVLSLPYLFTILLPSWCSLFYYFNRWLTSHNQTCILFTHWRLGMFQLHSCEAKRTGWNKKAKYRDQSDNVQLYNSVIRVAKGWHCSKPKAFWVLWEKAWPLHTLPVCLCMAMSVCVCVCGRDIANDCSTHNTCTRRRH